MWGAAGTPWPSSHLPLGRVSLWDRADLAPLGGPGQAGSKKWGENIWGREWREMWRWEWGWEWGEERGDRAGSGGNQAGSRARTRVFPMGYRQKFGIRLLWVTVVPRGWLP